MTQTMPRRQKLLLWGSCLGLPSACGTMRSLFPRVAGAVVACPFFMPTEKLNLWAHPTRLPLGGGWQGNCTAPGNGGVRPNDEELREFCNLGYAKGCARLPQDRYSDAVRFAISGECGGKVALCFVCEVGHRPGEHGVLEYDLARATWTVAHRDACVQRMAECYLATYLERRIKQARR